MGKTRAAILLMGAGLCLGGCPTPEALIVPPTAPGMADPGKQVNAPLPAYVTVEQGTEEKAGLPSEAAAAPPAAPPPAALPRPAAGTSPAVIASRLNPIEALRSA